MSPTPGLGPELIPGFGPGLGPGLGLGLGPGLGLSYFSSVLAKASLAPPEKACYSIEKKEEEDTSLWKLQENIMIM